MLDDVLRKHKKLETVFEGDNVQKNTLSEFIAKLVLFNSIG
jgi:hypothetical protein